MRNTLKTEMEKFSRKLSQVGGNLSHREHCSSKLEITKIVVTLALQKMGENHQAELGGGGRGNKKVTILSIQGKYFHAKFPPRRQEKFSDSNF